MQLSRKIHILILTVLVCLSFFTISYTYTSMAAVPIRISVKFILDANNQRPVAGEINTDPEVMNAVNRGVSILRDAMTEFSIETTEIVDLPGVSQWFNTPFNNEPAVFSLNSTAREFPTLYRWRDDALNIYINGADGGGVAILYPNEGLILLNQRVSSTTLLHEMGHSFGRLHTHEDDGCDDTLSDDSTWTSKDQMAQFWIKTDFANLTLAQQDAVNMTWNNIMSYHDRENRHRISPCQMNSISLLGDRGSRQRYAKQPLYVDRSAVSCYDFGIPYSDGRFACPYANFQDALNYGWLTNNVLVLQQGSFNANVGATINTNVEVITRSGPSAVSAPEPPLYTLPVDIFKSANPQVRAAVRAAQSEDTNARMVIKNAEAAASLAATPEAQGVFMIDAKKASLQHLNNAMTHLLDAEINAVGDEKLAIQLELAQRYRDSGDCATAIRFFRLVADTTDQPGLKEYATREENMCVQKIK